MASLVEFECPKCGGNVIYDSKLHQMKCQYCDSFFTEEELAIFDKKLKSGQEDSIQWQTEEKVWSEEQSRNAGKRGFITYVCESCGGEIVAEKTTASTKCPWCDSLVVIKGNLAGDLQPDYIIPFQFDREEAKRRFAEEMKKKTFLPRAFREKEHLDDLHGVYVPFWLFDAEVSVRAQYEGVKVKTCHRGGKTYENVEYYRLYREGHLEFEKIPADASSKMADGLMDSLEPFDMKGLLPFQVGYLAGFQADKYDVTSKKSEPRANGRVKESTRAEVRKTVGNYENVIEQKMPIRVDHGKISYGLLPVWILNTNWNGRRYVCALNGQTGLFAGNLPMGKGEQAWFFWKHVLITMGIATGLCAVKFLFFRFLGW